MVLHLPRVSMGAAKLVQSACCQEVPALMDSLLLSRVLRFRV